MCNDSYCRCVVAPGLQATPWMTQTLSTAPPTAPSCASPRSWLGSVRLPLRLQLPPLPPMHARSAQPLTAALLLGIPIPNKAQHVMVHFACGPSFPRPLLSEETLAAADSLRDEPPTSFMDRVFDNEMNIAVARTRAAYDRMLFREALKAGWWVRARVLAWSGSRLGPRVQRTKPEGGRERSSGWAGGCGACRPNAGAPRPPACRAAGTTCRTRVTCTALRAAPRAATVACCCGTSRCDVPPAALDPGAAFFIAPAAMTVLAQQHAFLALFLTLFAVPPAGLRATAGPHLPAHMRAHLEQPAEEARHGDHGCAATAQQCTAHLHSAGLQGCPVWQTAALTREGGYNLWGSRPTLGQPACCAGVAGKPPSPLLYQHPPPFPPLGRLRLQLAGPRRRRPTTCCSRPPSERPPGPPSPLPPRSTLPRAAHRTPARALQRHPALAPCLQVPGRHDSQPAQGHRQGGDPRQASQGRGAAAGQEGGSAARSSALPGGCAASAAQQQAAQGPEGPGAAGVRAGHMAHRPCQAAPLELLACSPRHGAE